MIFKIALAGIAVCFINILLKKYLSEFVLPVEIIYISLTLVLLLDVFKDISGIVSDYFESVKYGGEILTTVIKGMGICLLSKFSSDICSENGSKTVADIIEFSGRIMLMALALPYIESVIGVALAFIK